MRLFGRRGAQRIGASLAFAARGDFVDGSRRKLANLFCNGESPNIQSPENNSGNSTGKKTPGGAGTHTGHTRDTRAHTGTRITQTNLTKPIQ